MKLKQTQRPREENEGTLTNPKTQRRKENEAFAATAGAFVAWSLHHLGSVAFIVMVWSLLFGFDLRCFFFVVWVWSSFLRGFDLCGSWFLCVSKLCCWSWSWNGFVCFVVGLWVCLGLLISFFSRSVEVEVISFLSRLKLSFVSLWDEVEFLSLGNSSLKNSSSSNSSLWNSSSTLPTLRTQVSKTWVAIVNSSLKDSSC